MSPALGELIRTARQQRGWSQRDLAAMLCDTSGHPTLTHTEIGRWERGLVTPGPFWVTHLSAVLGVPLDELRAARAHQRRHHPERERVAAIAADGLRADTAAVDAVADVLASVRHLEDETSAAVVLPTVRQQADLVEQLAHKAPSGTRGHAVGLLSEIEQYMGWLSIPLENWSASQRHLDRAAVLAMEVDDPMRLSTALSFQAYRALRLGRPREADPLSQAASRDERTHVALRTYLAYQRAEILARSDDRADATRVLADADELAEQVDADDLPESGYWYTPAFFAGQRAFVLRALGETRAAARAAEESLAAMPDTWRESEWAQRRRLLADSDA